MPDKTQDECRQDFRNFLIKSFLDINEIDCNTPFNGSINEPKWWLDMMEIQRKIREIYVANFHKTIFEAIMNHLEKNLK